MGRPNTSYNERIFSNSMELLTLKETCNIPKRHGTHKHLTKLSINLNTYLTHLHPNAD